MIIEYPEFLTGDICWIYYDNSSYCELIKIISKINNTAWYDVEILWKNQPMLNNVIYSNTTKTHAINLIKCNVLELAQIRLILDNAVYDIIKNATK